MPLPAGAARWGKPTRRGVVATIKAVAPLGGYRLDRHQQARDA